MKKVSLEHLKILIFLAFYYLILKFYQANVIDRWKLIQKWWSCNFDHCLKAGIVILSHALTWFLNINNWINNSAVRKLHFIICLVSVLISVIFTERVSIFGTHWVLISIIQKTHLIAFNCTNYITYDFSWDFN